MLISAIVSKWKSYCLFAAESRSIILLYFVSIVEIYLYIVENRVMAFSNVVPVEIDVLSEDPL